MLPREAEQQLSQLERKGMEGPGTPPQESRHPVPTAQPPEGSLGCWSLSSPPPGTDGSSAAPRDNALENNVKPELKKPKEISNETAQAEVTPNTLLSKDTLAMGAGAQRAPLCGGWVHSCHCCALFWLLEHGDHSGRSVTTRQCSTKAPAKWLHIFVPAISPSERYLRPPGIPLWLLPLHKDQGWAGPGGRECPQVLASWLKA